MKDDLMRPEAVVVLAASSIFIPIAERYKTDFLPTANPPLENLLALYYCIVEMLFLPQEFWRYDMAVSKFERDVFTLKLSVNRHPKTAPDSSLEDTLDVFRRVYRAGESLMYLDDNGYPSFDDAEAAENRDPRNSIYIADLDIDAANQRAVFLLNRGDPSITTTSFINTETHMIRTPEIEEGETIGHSAHMVFDLNPANMIGGTYRCYLERMPTVSRTLVKAFLNKHLANDFERRGMTYTNKKNEDVNFRPLLRMEGLMSDTLENDLQAGTLTMIEFSKSVEEFQGIDLAGRIREIRHRVQIKVTPDNADGLFGWVMGLKNQAREQGFEEFQLHIRGLDGNKSVSPRFKTDLEDAAEFLYMKVDTISDFPDALEQCCSVINPDIRDKMLLLT